MYPSLEKVRKIAASGEYRRNTVCMEMLSDSYTPVEVLRTLRKVSNHCYLLESAAAGITGEGILFSGMIRSWR